ncbi:hypothetical protein E2562_035167 [Oryza meyeriana var. granulata]|uniref:Uncharacterized protein n=1 Tax=Oryza meyeriana var. granulata TaxID=110450 RepID=A0A6G1E7B3_9ORYZ|nr:hypothetical protein E2562_035167 [Oryza meyeriana var. granulata]
MIGGTAKPPTPPPAVVDKTMCAACDILKLLPTGTVLAFHELAPSFTNHGGACGAASRYVTTALIVACATSCVLFSFTDSLVSRADGRLYYGVATRRGFRPFNFEGTREEMEDRFGDLPGMKVRALDFVHALVSAVVFVVVALGNAEIQGCLFPDVGPSVREMLNNLPVAFGLMASMVFMIFPTTRKGIGYTDMKPHKEDDRKGGTGTPGQSTLLV